MKVGMGMRNRATLVGVMGTAGAAAAGRSTSGHAGKTETSLMLGPITFKLLYLGKLLKLSNKGLYRKA